MIVELFKAVWRHAKSKKWRVPKKENMVNNFNRLSIEALSNSRDGPAPEEMATGSLWAARR